ncbi:MAG: hypothetical protein KDH20_07355 [Rhodocyclaceae bacterium]|nr:hypothetical protein [Rhodocyclaceae bacterium]
MRGAAAAGALLLVAGCGGGGGGGGADEGSASGGGGSGGAVVDSGTGAVTGNPAGACVVPDYPDPVLAAQPPATVVGDGTPDSCTGAAVVAAVAAGGWVTFACGDAPVIITMTETARVFNDRPDLILDGGGKVTLSGGGTRRILYQNTCDPALVWTSTRCDLQDNPHTTIRDLAMVDGDSSGQDYGRDDVLGGGAIFARGGRLTVDRVAFRRNRCEALGPDLGGAALRAVGMPAAPLRVIASTFGGSADDGNVCANGGGLSGLHASFAIYNSHFSHNRAIGDGANPARAGTAGGGSGGAIYMDGTAMDLSVCGTTVTDNTANEGGGAIFYVSNDRSGTMSLTDSQLARNPSAGFETSGLPGMFVLAADGQPVISGTTLAP